MLARGVGAKMKSTGDWTYPFREIALALSEADLVFGNLEGPISDRGRDLHHIYSFRADPRAIEGLSYARFGVLSLANNHAYDWDQEALLDTLRRLRAAGIRPVGAGQDDREAREPLLLELNGNRLAFLAYVNVPPEEAMARPDRPGVAWLDPDRVIADIRFARQLADVLVVAAHWGVEYAAQPQSSQVKLAHRMIDAGADLIVGSHPHVVQPIERYQGRWIAYSLGNFIFDQRAGRARRGLMLKVCIGNKQISDITPVPITIGPTFQARITVPEELVLKARRTCNPALHVQ